LRPVFAARLAEWGLQSDEPIAEAILLRSPEDLKAVAQAFPAADFNVPASWLPALTEAHDVQVSGERAFLLARGVDRRVRRTLPAGW